MTVSSDGTPASPATDRLAALPKSTSAVAVRERLLDLLRRGLVGPLGDLDPDLAREVLSGSSPSNWYLTGYLGARRKTGEARRLAAVTDSETAPNPAPRKSRTTTPIRAATSGRRSPRPRPRQPPSPQRRPPRRRSRGGFVAGEGRKESGGGRGRRRGANGPRSMTEILPRRTWKKPTSDFP